MPMLPSEQEIHAAGLGDIAARLDRGERLSAADAERLWSTPALHAVRALADRMRRRLHGDRLRVVRAVGAAGLTAVDAAQPLPAALLALRGRAHPALLVHDPGRQRTALELLRAFACARLLCDDVPHVCASALELGPNLVQIATGYGVDQILEPLPAQKEVAA
ncbi:MAG TPA: hypothetical protein VKN99_10170 [Polyangia bacterium]|nr:hypothetical protein [Polyangia bacterium]